MALLDKNGLAHLWRNIEQVFVKKGALFPVGYVYTSVVNVSPQAFYGGTWKQLTEGYIRVVGPDAEAGVNAGNNTLTFVPQGTVGEAEGQTGETVLTVEQLPAHMHTVNHVANFNAAAGTDKWVYATSTASTSATGETGGGEGHSHTIDEHTHPFTGEETTITVQPRSYDVYAWVRIA